MTPIDHANEYRCIHSSNPTICPIVISFQQTANMLILKKEKLIMNVLKSLLQPCYAVMLASVVLFLPSICTANNNVNAAVLFFPSTHVVNDNIKIDSSPFYIKFSAGIVNTSRILEAGLGYRLNRHRMDIRLGFMVNILKAYNFVQGNYYYNIITGNIGSIFATGGIMSVFKEGIRGELGIGISVDLYDIYYTDLEFGGTYNNSDNSLPFYIRSGFRLHC
ncbi:membrane protein [Orientia tsutsugamushi]|nr:putative ompA-like autotransporter [Orientia tsutsugamushi str. TA763]SPP23757.1 membrane protein [Orientia tsutsugamushi]